MGQLIDRIFRLAKSKVNDFTFTSSDPHKNENDELKRIIDELNKEKQKEEDSKAEQKQTKQETPQPKAEQTVSSACTMLGVSVNASIEDIKSAYKQRMKEYHPDRVANLGAELKDLARKKTQEFNDAYQFLKKVKGF